MEDRGPDKVPVEEQPGAVRGSCCFCPRGRYSNCHHVNLSATAVGATPGYSHTSGPTVLALGTGRRVLRRVTRRG